MRLILQRVSSGQAGTFGVILQEEIPLCTTCEDPWNSNKPNISCIPAGTYSCVKHTGRKFSNVWVLLDVPGRSGILIHNGNNIDHTEGCILVGQGFNLFGRPGVINSVDTLNRLRQKLPDEFELTIRDMEE